MSVGGGSADRKAEELAEVGDAAAGAWAAGAEGERRVATALSDLREAWTVLHDRLLRPGLSEANLDHVVIGPGGVFLVDAKNRAGRVTEWEGGLFQHTIRNGEPTSVSLASELAKVHGMSAYMAVESAMPVTPVLCLAGSHEANFGEPQMVRGVWVVPVSKLASWLEARDAALDREAAAGAVTRSMTNFPSTTTDPALLAAMGQAAESVARPTRGRGVTRSRRTSAARPPFAARLGRLFGSLFITVLVFLLLLAFLPRLLTEGVQRLVPTVPSAPTSAQAPGAVPSPETKAAKPAQARSTQLSSTPRPPALAPTDCARATGTQISATLKRKVLPIAVATGCAWGSRLDDVATVLVTVEMKAGHAAYENELATSAKQRRVVYGAAYDRTFKPSTALWVATGQPIVKGKSPVKAVADTHVVVSTDRLMVTDDQARQMALAIAAAANR